MPVNRVHAVLVSPPPISIPAPPGGRIRAVPRPPSAEKSQAGKPIHQGESVFAPKGCLRRMYNPGRVPLEIIEVQIGEYAGEDDIVRIV